jgi:hypothetical protein
MPPRTPTPDALSRWLAAERSGLAEDAEAALAELLGGLPRPAPPAGFADRVMARALAAPAAAAPAGAETDVAGAASPVPSLARRPAISWRSPRRLHLGRRLAASLGLAAAAAALLVLLSLPVAMRALAGAASLFGLLAAGVGSILDLGHRLAAVIALGNQLRLLVRAVAEPLATPPMVALAGGGLALSILALRFLYDLIQRDRRWVYADPI